jgi:two-component system chemotaxis sensor kinase CheA
MRVSARTSLRAKLVRTMVATLAVVGSATLVVVAAMNVSASRRMLGTIESHLRGNIVDKGTGLVTHQALALRDLVADNAFSDVGRLVERTVSTDRDLVYGMFVDQSGKAWALASTRSGETLPTDWRGFGIALADAATGRGVHIAHKEIARHGAFEFSTPVVDDRGEAQGLLVYAISDAPLTRALAEARGDSWRALGLTAALLILLGVATNVFGIVLSRRAAAKITRPVSELNTAVDALAAGNHEIRVAIASGDELEALGHAFNRMASELKESYASLAEMNRTLERKVEERTSELASRNRDMRLVLDNVNQGFLTVSARGVLAQERSTIVDTWFGQFGAEVLFSDYIGRVDGLYAGSFQMGYDAILEDILPLELSIEQMPARLRSGGREFRCSYMAILKEDRFDGLLIVINDVTTELLHVRQEAERKEILSMFEALSRDRTGFLNFMDEASEMVHQLGEGHRETDTQRRLLHTLKGNSALVGFGVVAQICHHLEDLLEEAEGGALGGPALAPLLERWGVINESLRRFVGDKGHEVMELNVREIERVEEMIRSGAPTTRVLDRLASWWLEPTDVPMNRLGRYAAALANRLGKAPVEVEVRSNGIRLAPKAWAGFWTDLVHVVRNAVDHGLETVDERVSQGKPPVAHVRMSSYIHSGNRLVVEIADDGRGVDWEAVRRKAANLGLPSDTEADLVRAIFTTGVTTRDEVTTLSGRGVGLSAVRQQVEDLGGTTVVETERGHGTCFRFTFSLPDVGPRFGVDMGTCDGGARTAA